VVGAWPVLPAWPVLLSIKLQRSPSQVAQPCHICRASFGNWNRNSLLPPCRLACRDALLSGRRGLGGG
jgi:hypothetical protein